jgi:hypothetical protein
LIEIDPAYVDTAILRWQQYTGKAAVLDGGGRTFQEVAAQLEREKKAPPIHQAAPADFLV